MIGEDAKATNFWRGWAGLSHPFGNKYGCPDGHIVQDAL
jgi:hypothetical protein